ncbi:exodeoxyribonuclease V subunit alpha [Lysobacteraceae bacterium NML08-0793]|nr:exodeoxyribonuclease V subunit alpha [Xanthomonadaceae bacterium NML08-0793]
MSLKPAGSHFNFQPLSLPLKGENWRPLEYALARWVLAHGGDAALARLAAEASLADAEGQSALRIEDARQREQLAQMPLVGEGMHSAAPFILDGDLFYLRRNFAHELAVARRLAKRLEAMPPPTGGQPVDVESLFPEPQDPRVAAQLAAVKAALGQSLFVLSGGPGTGKTTTVLRMLMAQWQAQGGGLRIRLAAPTGKAAQRISESLRAARAEDFPPQWQAALAAVQNSQASTVHRLLGSRGMRGGWTQHSDEPLPVDVLVIDEASMLDLAMLRAVLDALPDRARLILVGDANQLDSVGTGSVLRDIVDVLDSKHLVHLHHSFRADRALLPLIEAVRQGESDAFQTALVAAGEQAQQQPVPSRAALHTLLESWAGMISRQWQQDGSLERIDTANHGEIARQLQSLRRQQLLCALRDGEYGAAGANALIEESLRRQQAGFNGWGGSTLWYPGRRIIITRNDETSGLWNGDVGLCLADEKGLLRVWFETASGEVRSVDIGALPPHQGAFAVTVHKAQGSEYGEVAVLLSPQPDHPLLTRQWFYTAISRAKQRLHVWGSDVAIAQAISTSVERIGGLRGRLRQMLTNAVE